ncbi:BAR domain-containing protein [Mycoplasma suis]|uniref:Uncharacterized protein n=1 Tax=Mycoplasma suis (strain Illinois) TaxID=768700 RepID=F0QRR2_MYCSL|nr:hypothetical protein [Mycoplasma suis]ADX98182.1 hypothetical protein MSU_0651 [Mycoplasma suis str. Illinois]
MKLNFQKQQIFFIDLSTQKEKLTSIVLNKRADLLLYLSSLRADISLLNLLVSSLNLKSKENQEKINEKIEELNKLRKELREINKEWEDIKEKVIFFKNYEGVLRNAICKNSELQLDELIENEEKINCEKSSQ